jgi:hypothetical protein
MKGLAGNPVGEEALAGVEQAGFREMRVGAVGFESRVWGGLGGVDAGVIAP